MIQRIRRKEANALIVLLIVIVLLIEFKYEPVISSVYFRLIISTVCKYEDFEITMPQKETWVSVPGAMLRSAFLDDRGGTVVVRVLAYFAVQEEYSYSCIYMSDCKTKTVNATRIKINDDPDVLPVFFECPPPSGTVANTLVTVLPNGLQPNLTTLNNSLLPIAYHENVKKKPNRTELIACISPLFNWISSKKLFLFVEYYKRLGVNHFHIYEKSVNNETKEYLNSLVKAGIATVIQWKSLPNVKISSGELRDTAKKINYHGQILSMNDCVLNAYLRNASFALTVDVDEFIWLKSENASTLLALLTEFDAVETGSVDFRSAYLYKEQDNFTRLGSLSGIFPKKERSKQVLKVKAIYRQTVHLTWEYFKGFNAVHVDPNVALIFHVREAATVQISSDSSVNSFGMVLQTISTDYDNRNVPV